MQQPTEQQFIDEWLPQLEQAAHIKESHARRWYNDVMAVEPDRFEWHFMRLKGWGGSDIGEIAASYLGEPNLFSTVYELGMDKLMIRSPGGQTPHMRRGTLLEEPLSVIHREDYGATRRDDLIEAIMVTTDPERKWLRGNPDEVVDMPSGSYPIALVDYKCTANLHDTIPIQYVCQIHQYHYLLELSGKCEIEEVGLQVVAFDYEAGLSYPIEFDYNPEYREAVLKGGDEAWQHVISGNLESLGEMRAPKEVADFQYEFSEEDVKALEQLEDTWSSLFFMRKVIAEKFDTATDAIKGIFAKYGRMHGHQDEMPLAVASPTIRRTANDVYINELIERGTLDLKDITSPGNSYDSMLLAEYVMTPDAKTGPDVDFEPFLTRKFDVKKVEEKLVELGFNPLEGVKEGISFTVRATKKKNLTKEDIDQAGVVAAGVIDQAEKQLQEMSQAASDDEFDADVYESASLR